MRSCNFTNKILFCMRFRNKARQYTFVTDRESPRVREEEKCLRKLGTVYVRRGVQTKDGQDFAKATALFNAALARGGNKHILVDAIKKAERLFLSHTVGVDREPSPYDTDIEHKKRLEKYRAEVKDRLETIHKDHNPYQYDEGDPLVKEVEMRRAESVRDLFKDISKQRRYFIKDLVKECIEAIGQPPCQYAMVGLGSQATELVTPYSDLEFAILMKENEDTPENKEYFVNLTCYLYLKIINMGETILPVVGIKSLNDFYSEDPADDWFYDSVTPRGFAFDGAMPWASKTPLGRKRTFMRSPFSLIQTPSGLAEFQRHADVYFVRDCHLPSTLMHVSLLTGDQALVDDYMARVKTFYQTSWGRVIVALIEHCKSTVPVSTSLPELSHLLWSDTYWQPTGKVLNVKEDIYRFPTVAALTLGFLEGVYASSVWDAIKEMEEAGLVSKENARHLQVLVSISGELRLRTYVELKGQKENLSGLTAMGTQLDGVSERLINSVFHVPDQKMLFRYYYTAHPLKTNIGLTDIPIGELSKHLGRRVTLYDASPSLKADICQGLLQFSAVITHTEDALRELAVDKAATTCLPGQSQDVTLYTRTSLLGQQAASYSQLGDHRKAVCCWEEQLKEQQQLGRHDLKVAILYSTIAMAWNFLGDEKNAIANLQQGWALMSDKDDVFMDPEITALIDDLIADVVMAGRGEIRNLDKAWFTVNQGISYLENLPNMLKERYGDLLHLRGVRASTLRNFGEIFNLIGDYTKAITFSEESLEIMRTIYGQDSAHPDIAALLTNLGISSCRGRNDHIKAIRYHGEALEMHKVVYGNKSHPATPGILHNLGVEWAHIGEYKKARSYFEQALQMLAAIHGGGEACHLDIGRVFRNLKRLCDDVGDTKCIGYSFSNLATVTRDNPKAIQLYEDTLDIAIIKGDKEKYPDVVMVLKNLTKICNKLEDHDKAIRYQEQELALKKAIHGRDTAHPDIAKSLTNLGHSLCSDLSDHVRAVGYYEEAFEMYKVLYGSDTPHQITADSLNNLGVAWQHIGELQKARNYYEQALQMQKTLHGEDEVGNPDIALVTRNLGSLWSAVGNNFKAISFYEDALKITEDHADIALLLDILGSTCRKAGEYTKSLQYYKRALEVNKDIHGQDAAHPDIVETLCNLGKAHKELADYTKAAQFYEDALKMAKTIHGASGTHGDDDVHHTDIAGILNNLGDLWLVVGDNMKAHALFEQALNMCQELYGQNTPHPFTALVLANIGEVMEKIGDTFKGITYYEEALKMTEEMEDECKEYSDIAYLLGKLGSAFHKAGEHTKSSQYCERALEMITSIPEKEAANPDIATTLSDLAAVYEDLEDYTKAIQLYEDAFDRVKTFRGANKTHPDILKLLNNLETVCSKAGDQEKANGYHWQSQSLKTAVEEQGEDNDITQPKGVA